MKDLSNENIVHVKKDGIEYLQFRKLLEYDDIIKHAYGIGLDRNYRTSRDKVDDEKYKKALNDYDELCSAIGVDYKNCVKPTQKHTKTVKNVVHKINIEEPDFGVEEYKNTDGLITDKKSNC